MIEITKDNYKDIDFNGVIISVPREHLKDELTQEFCFHFECAYYTKGEHGYKTPGHNPNKSSFFSIWYGDEDMPNGFGFNSTCRLPWDEKYLHFNNVRYYKFNNMQEFCVWYLETNKYFEKSDYGKWKEQKEWIQEKCNTNTPPTSVPECPSKGNIRKISPDVKSNEPLLWNGEEYIGLKVKRKHRLKEVQQYVQKVMNIADIKNSYEKTNDPRYKEKLEEQQKDLLSWLEEEV